MLRFMRSAVVALGLAGTLVVGSARGQNEGQDELDRATELRLSAKTFTDLGEVIRLCERALEKGLDEENKQFAKQLLASTRVQRGSVIASAIVNTLPPDPRWPQFRQAALEDLEKGVELDPNQPQALHIIAQLNFLPGGDEKRATEALDEAIRVNADDPLLKAKSLTLRAAFHQEPEKKLADLDEAVRLAPQDAAIVRHRGAAYAQQEQPEKALADFDTALKLEPDHARTHEARAEILIALKRYDEAVASLDQARELDPDSVVPLVQQARIYGLQSDYKAALDALNQAHAKEPGNVGVLLLRASVYQELDRRDEALADVDRTLRLKPRLPVAMRFRAMLLAGSGKFDQAISQLEDLLEEAPEDTEAQLQVALFYSAQNRPRKAIQVFDAVLAKSPDNPIALRGRADALLSIGKQAEAIADYQKALELRPEEAGILNNLAWVLATSPDEKLRDGKRAIELATKASELTEFKQAHILSTLAAAYAETGDFQTAIKWSEKAVEVGTEEQKEPLAKELESYRAEKPWRELQTTPEAEEPEPEPPDPDEPEEPEPEPAPPSEGPVIEI